MCGGWRSPLSVVALCVTVACVQDAGRPGPLGGPSELGLSLSLTATPDMLPLDGTTYTAPPPTTSGPSVDTGEVVTISVTPVDGNFSNAVSRGLTIRLVPPGKVIPPFDATPGFAFTPATPTVFNAVLFTTACMTTTSTDCVRDPAGIVTSYRWNFGNGRSASGPTASTSYLLAGTYLVTLTIRDGTGRLAEVTHSVVVAGGTPPTAALSVSPTDPKEGDSVFFNASGSTAAPGRTIVSQSWDFGDGSTGSGVTESHAYHTAGTYTVTLKVTDDKGQVGTATASVVVGVTGPTTSNIHPGWQDRGKTNGDQRRG